MKRTIEPIEADRNACRREYAQINRTFGVHMTTAAKQSRARRIKQCLDAFTECQNIETLDAARANTLPPMPPLPILFRNGVKLLGVDMAKPFGKRKG